jgi:hypothetical protein
VETRPSLDSQPAIAISMSDNLIVLRPQGRLDLDATHALVAAVDAAGPESTVLIDLDGAVPEPEAVPGTRATFPASFEITTTIGRATIEVLGPGCVRLRSPQSHWTIDLNERRFCRSSRPLDRCFVAPDDWTSIRSIWATSDGVSVLTNGDAIISTATRWVSAVA